MEKNGIIRVAAAAPRVWLADVRKNKQEMLSLVEEAAVQGARYIAFPAHALTGATCGDLVRQEVLIEAERRAKDDLLRAASDKGITLVTESCSLDGIEFECAADPETVTSHRWKKVQLAEKSFSGGSAIVYCTPGYGESTTDAVYGGGAMIFNKGRLLATNKRFQRASSLIVADIDPACESVTPQESPALLSPLDSHPFVPSDEEELALRCQEILDIQVTGLATRLEHVGSRRATIGISGGLDSTLALLVTCLAFDSLGKARKDIIAVTMPGFGTSERTHSNADALMKGLGVDQREISIVKAVQVHLDDIGHEPGLRNAAYENAQARERTQILMDLANDCDALVVGTGDLSEIALGWCTYNGDHMSMYGVNAGVPKTLMQAMVRWSAEHRFPQVRETLLDIVDTPISPELTPTDENGQIHQKTEDLIGPYELHDFFLYYLVRRECSPSKILTIAKAAFKGKYDDASIEKWLRKFLWRFFSQQFKRSCSPDGPRIGSVCLSPRGGWSMPSDASVATWIEDLG